MTAWTTFWGWLLVCVLLVFAVVSLVVTIGGLFDIKDLLRTLGPQVASDQSSIDARDESDGENPDPATG